MKRLILPLALLVLGLTTSACNGDNPSEPSSTSKNTFNAVLLPVNEVPAIVGAEAAGSGTATITLNLAKDSAGYVTGATFDFAVTVTGFPNGTSLTGAHIHGGAPGTNGGILVSLGLSAGDVTFATGAGSFSRTGITTTVDQANAILANPGSFYFNIHTAANSGGVARGQLAIAQ
jgi:trimeric autotransporter adhesin